jgi:ABC-type branched-subunit amino acid transport system ATPase component
MIEVSQIDVAYNGAHVLHGANISLQKSELVFIVGRNGAGKTTLLKTIAGLLRPAKGSIRFNGQEIQGMQAEELARRGIRFVAQDKRVFSSLTVRSNIELAAYAAGVDIDSAVARVLSLYPKLEKFMDQKAGGLSGGQREILLIGRGLVGNPSVILIDEPTEGLAATVINDIFRILVHMKETMSAIIVEQNLSLVRKLADRVYVMKEGKVTQTLTRDDLAAGKEELERYL